MPAPEEALARLPLFADLTPEELAAAARAWRPRTLAPGERLWEQGAAVDELAIVTEGLLVATLGGVEVARVHPGELVGEIAAFFAGQARSLALTAHPPCSLLVLPVTGLRTLRWQRSVLYVTLLDHALHAVAARLRSVDAAISRRGAGGHEPPAPPASPRWWRSATAEGPTDPRPDTIRVLRSLPAMREAADEPMLAVADAFAVEPLSRGQLLCREGEPGADAWVLASGAVDTWRHGRGDGAELLATLGPGARFGLLSLVDGGPRTATGIVTTPGWALRITAPAYAALTGDARLRWQECMLAALGSQVRGANEILAGLGGNPADVNPPEPLSTPPKAPRP